MIIDSHIHLTPGWAGIVESTSMGRVRDRGTGEEFQMLPPSWEDSASPPERALAFMDWTGIDRAIVMQGARYGEQNDYVASAVKQWPDRFAGFAGLDDLRSPEAPDRLELALESGLLGLKIVVGAQRTLNPGFSFLGEGEMSVWARLNDLRKTLALHLRNGEEGAQEAREVRQLLDTFPNLEVIICHIGWPRPEPDKTWHERAMLGTHDRVMMDISAIPVAFSNEGYPYPTGREALRWTIDQVGASKLMWGSDYPVVLKTCTYQQTMDFLRHPEPLLSSEEEKLIMGENAARKLNDWQSR